MKKYIILIIILVSIVFIYSRFFQPPTDMFSETEKTLSIVTNNMSETLSQALLFAEQGNLEEISNLLDQYSHDFEEFTKEIIIFDTLDTDSLEKDNIISLRLMIWENYNQLLKLEEFIGSSIKFTQIKEKTIAFIQERMIRAVDILSFDFSRKNTASRSKNLFSLLSLIPAVYAETRPDNLVVYKKMTFDFKNPGANIVGNANFVKCFLYESWQDIETGSIREKSSVVSGSNCSVEIDITDASGEKKLGLDPINKRAEWIYESGKIGISGGEKIADPYEQFVVNLENGSHTLEGTSVIEGKKVYEVKRVWGSEFQFEVTYVDAETYLPIRKSNFGEKIEFKNQAFDIEPVREVVGTILQFNFVITGELLNKDSLPKDFFDLIIPQDYRLEEFVGQG